MTTSMRAGTEGALAALADRDTGDIERPLAGIGWAVPNRVDLDATSDRLVWSWGGAPRWVESTETDRLLERFVALGTAETKAESILTFARSFGVLHICGHGLPASHHPDAAPLRLALDLDNPLDWPMGCEPLTEDGGRTAFEPIAAWRRFAGEALALAWHVARMQTGEFSGDPLGPLTGAMRIQETLNEWVAMGRVRPVCDPHIGHGGKDATLIPTFGGDGLFGALALRLLLAATGAKGLAICAACGEVFAPARKQQSGKLSWHDTPECHKIRAARESAKTRQKNRSEAA